MASANSDDKPNEAEEKKKPTKAQRADKDGEVGLMNYLKRALNIADDKNKEKPEQLLETLTAEGVAKFINSEKCKHIVTMAGAGISTSAGIPDFRSAGTGLYDNLQKYKLPSPEAIFQIDYFRENPEPFFTLAKELWPGCFKPTPCHYFIKMLSDKGLLLRHYTQNIDTLERVAGVPGEKIVEAHGTFHTSHCIECRKEFSQDWIKDKIFNEGIPHCTAEGCEGLVKPDIVFFGEKLTDKFYVCVKQDFTQCDLLIIMGTSLVVQPFASLTGRVKDTTPRLYINMEKTGVRDDAISMLMYGSGFQFDSEDNYRDVFWKGTCDDGCNLLADQLGWGKDLTKMVTDEHERIDTENKMKPNIVKSKA